MNHKINMLFTSILGPYGVDTERSSFKNPMSLLANQVTRGQKYYTVQMAQRTFAYDLFAVNLNANVTILDFPNESNLYKILKKGKWDRIGTSSIIPNFNALVDTIKLIRKTLLSIPIDIGGHIANDDEVIKKLINKIREFYPNETFTIHYPGYELKKINNNLNEWLVESKCFGPGITIVRRDGLEYYANLKGVGLKSNQHVYAPLVNASFGKTLFGIPIPFSSAGLIIPDVGCPKRCNFCATSHKFDGRFVKFLDKAEDIFNVAKAFEKEKGKTDFFVMSENFSLNTKRALNLLKLMEDNNKAYSYSVFSSADSLVKLGVENIVKLGYNFIWIGLEESSGTTFQKMQGIDLRELIDDLQNHGVEILGSTILGFENHDEKMIKHEIKHALNYNCVYNQFMLYMPIPGTTFYKEMENSNRIIQDFPLQDLHGQKAQNWKHPKLAEDRLEFLLDHAFEMDYEILGPSLYRMIDVHYRGYINTKNWNHKLVQMRRMSMRKKFIYYVPIMSAMINDFKGKNHPKYYAMKNLHQALNDELTKSEKASAYALSHVFSFALGLEKYNDKLRKLQRRSVSPKTLLTMSEGLKEKFKLSNVVLCEKIKSIPILNDRFSST